jgi:hypothetical protein
MEACRGNEYKKNITKNTIMKTAVKVGIVIAGAAALGAIIYFGFIRKTDEIVDNGGNDGGGSEGEEIINSEEPKSITYKDGPIRGDGSVIRTYSNGKTRIITSAELSIKPGSGRGADGSVSWK